ncbi:MAG: hypothetical protein M1820_003544 [Bogoriella megaspora]|nr:MAG: hypothetical protein M1820_003544 [Bogoriella megaspora]
MSSSHLESVDTVIIGNGPSALILSYILHGWIPHYSGGHHDRLLDTKLSQIPDLLSLKPDLYDHFQSSLKYSTQALPINVLLDTLLRPNADTEASPTPCVKWKYTPERAVPHIVIGDTGKPGGQWAEEDDTAKWDIQALSYAEMLSLPGYSFADYHFEVTGQRLAEFIRPSRREVTAYFSAYPNAVGIQDSIRTSTAVKGISRQDNGFFLHSQNVTCRHLVLASGTFSIKIPPRPLLQPLASLDNPSQPLLVIGSGFTAADAIISASPHRKILHIFKWAPDDRPSPLRGCHYQAYPEYAGVYRQMKLAASTRSSKQVAISPYTKRRKNNPFFKHRDWYSVYEGFPNTRVIEVNILNDYADLKLMLESGEVISRRAGGLECAIGRRGSLDYLNSSIRREILCQDWPGKDQDGREELISGKTLRSKCEVDLEVAPQIFAIGSLTGDSLVRFAFGGCAYAAGRIMAGGLSHDEKLNRSATTINNHAPSEDGPVTSDVEVNGSAHQDLHLDRRKLARSLEVISAENMVWKRSGWWSGGFMLS